MGKNEQWNKFWGGKRNKEGSHKNGLYLLWEIRCKFISWPWRKNIMKSSGLNKVPVFGQSKVLCDKSLHSSSHLILTPILWEGTIIYRHFSDELKKNLSNLPSHTARNLQNQNFNLEKSFSRLFSRASAFNLNHKTCHLILTIPERQVW